MKESKSKKEKAPKKESAKKISKKAIKNKMIEVLLTLDPAMKEKKVLKRAKKATKVLGKGLGKKGTTLVIAEVLEMKQA